MANYLSSGVVDADAGYGQGSKDYRVDAGLSTEDMRLLRMQTLSGQAREANMQDSDKSSGEDQGATEMGLDKDTMKLALAGGALLIGGAVVLGGA